MSDNLLIYKDIEDFFKESVENYPINPNYRTIDKDKKKFSLLNMMGGEKNVVLVDSKNLNIGFYAFSCFVNDYKKLPNRCWSPILLEEEEEEKEEENYLINEIPVDDSDIDDKKNSPDVFDLRCSSKKKIKTVLVNTKIMVDIFTLSLLQDCRITNWKRFEEKEKFGFERVDFIDDNVSEEMYIKKEEFRKEMMKKSNVVIEEKIKIV